MYIYKFTHTETGRCYIGQTIQDPNHRRLEHICDSRHTPRTYHFHNALKKYGEDAFSFEVIAEATSVEELNLLEEKFINQFDSINNGFNIRHGGGNKKHNPESIERMRVAQKASHAKRRNDGREGGWVRKDGGPMKGKQCSEQNKQKKRDAHLKANHFGGKTWKLIDGKRVWLAEEATV